MIARERVLKALAHEEPDRLPIDLGGSIVTGINAMAYQKLKEHMGLTKSPLRVTNIILLLADVDKALRERWGVDVIPLNRYEAAPRVPLSGAWKPHPLPNGTRALFPEGFSPLIKENGAWELYDQGNRVGVLSPGSGSFVPAYFPLARATVEALETFTLPGISDTELEWLHKTARELYKNTDYAVFGWFNGSIFEQAQFLCGWDSFMLRLAGEPEFAELLLTKLTDRVIEDLKLYLEAVGKYIQVIGFGDDFGIQTGPQIAPALFRKLIKPLLARIYSTAHGLSEAKVFLHSCGSVYEFIEDFIEIGVDILNPVQTSSRNMGLERLKNEFGKRICFWGGGTDVQRILPQGTAAEVRKDVRRRLEVMRGDGGFVFAPIHNIQADVPPENIAAMYEEAAGI